jgi:hypothetical protein
VSNTYRGRIRRLRQVAGQALPQYGIEPVSISLLVAHVHNTTFKVIGSDCHRRVRVWRHQVVGLLLPAVRVTEHQL